MVNRQIPAVRFRGFADDWEQRKLGELMNVTSVKRIHQSDWTTSGVRFLRARDIVSESKGEKPDDLLYISQDKYDEYTAISGKVKIGDLLVTGVGTIGVPMLIKNESPIYFKDGNIIWFQNENKIDGNFFYYVFTSRNVQQFIKDSAGIGTVGTYTIDSGKKTLVTIPPDVEEQKKIGEFFASLDSTIALHQSEYKKLIDLKKSMLQKMFPKNGEKIPEVRFAGFTEAWEQRKLSEIAKNTYGGGTPKTSIESYWKGNIPWIQSQDLNENQVSGVEPRKHISEEAVSKSATKIVPKNSIAIITRVGVGKLAFMPFSYCTSQDFLSLSDLTEDGKFATYAIFKMLQEEKGKVQGTSIKGITIEEMLLKQIYAPKNRVEQEQIGHFFTNIDNAIALHRRR